MNCSLIRSQPENNSTVTLIRCEVLQELRIFYSIVASPSEQVVAEKHVQRQAREK